jgi:maltose operon protein
MKMKKSLVALCLSAGLLACVPAITFADVNFVPQNTSAALLFRRRRSSN